MIGLAGSQIRQITFPLLGLLWGFALDHVPVTFDLKLGHSGKMSLHLAVCYGVKPYFRSKGYRCGFQEAFGRVSPHSTGTRSPAM